MSRQICRAPASWCMLGYDLRLQTRQIISDFRCSQLRQRAEFHAIARLGTLFNHRVQGVAGSNPAVPINCISRNDLRLRSPFVIQGVSGTSYPTAMRVMRMFSNHLSGVPRGDITPVEAMLGVCGCMWCMSWCMNRAKFCRDRWQNRITLPSTQGLNLVFGSSAAPFPPNPHWRSPSNASGGPWDTRFASRKRSLKTFASCGGLTPALVR